MGGLWGLLVIVNWVVFGGGEVCVCVAVVVVRWGVACVCECVVCGVVRVGDY